jgi:hypothetical protein
MELTRQLREKFRGYGLTDAAFSRLENCVIAFGPMAGAPRGEIARRVTLTSTLDQELRELTSLLDDFLDPLMNQFQAPEPKFFADYHNAGVLVQLATPPIETVRERAAAKAEARKAAKTERVAARAAAKAEAKAQRQSRLWAEAFLPCAAGTR